MVRSCPGLTLLHRPACHSAWFLLSRICIPYLSAAVRFYQSRAKLRRRISERQGALLPPLGGLTAFFLLCPCSVCLASCPHRAIGAHRSDNWKTATARQKRRKTATNERSISPLSRLLSLPDGDIAEGKWGGREGGLKGGRNGRTQL